ncbi:alpha/beta fold hydrolase [Brevundimonas albigilva]|uniref:Alpha/beta hydrolase n=1 Tax=Brevundimonas albigilva TaxID=1312364 RepID=A0ABY4SNT2_9CAUL|nr:alpha/beta hydrolase [Brevundimonas albigilva]URI14709.1 alpha/beta hydrolase [Brevundimonas albigilva]
MTLSPTVVGAEGVPLVADAFGQDGPWIVLLHGGGQTRRSWKRSAEAIAAGGFRALAYDARGHGDSGWSPTGDYALPRLEEDLAAIADTLDGPIGLVGASMGGLTALRAAGTFLSRRVAALVLVDIAVSPTQAGSARILEFMEANPNGFSDIDEVVAALTRYNPLRPASTDTRGLERNLRKGADGRLRWHWDPALMETGPRLGRGDFTHRLNAAAPGITAPTLLVHGAASDVIDADGLAEMRRLIPHIRFSEVPAASHVVAGDRNDRFSNRAWESSWFWSSA